MTLLAVKLAGSLVAILLVAWLARLMRLGGDVRLGGVDDALRLADATHCGFDPVDVIVDRAGIGALLRDAEGRVMLLRRHGAQFVGRFLDSHAHARLDREFLTIAAGERLQDPVVLHLGPDAQIWAASLRHLDR